MKNDNAEGIILAAGLSSRAGTFKMALPFKGKNILQCAVENMHTACSNIVVVAGHLPQRIHAITLPYPYVQTVDNESFKKGMFSSVQRGAAALQGKDFFFITPGDYPDIDGDVYHRLLEAAMGKKGTAAYDILVPTYNGRNGHPVLLRKHLAPLLLAEPPNSNLKVFTRRHGVGQVDVDCEGILLDVDTMEDYTDLKKR
ncbi:MAG: nucleotidyltransferase family protein [bacterium]|nr:nucleotidyltransferase family protein [bacterium]